MELGWNIFPWVAVAVFVLSLFSAIFALRKRERSSMAIACSATAIALFVLFVASLWMTLEK